MICTKYFELAYDVICDQVNSIARTRGVSPGDIHAELVSHLQRNSAEWFSGRQPQIPYCDPICRMAYVYACVPLNANVVQWALASDPRVRAHLIGVQGAENRVRVCAFGGGPGTELLGMSKFVEVAMPRGLHFQFEYQLLDRVHEWSETWQAFRRRLEDRFRAAYGPQWSSWPWTAVGQFSPIDITATNQFANFADVFSHDLYILSYVVSEVYDDADALSDFMGIMAEHSPKGALFLFMDRLEPRWKRAVRGICADAGLTVLDEEDSRGTMDSDEDCRALGSLRTDVGRSPRLKWSCFRLVAVKP